MKNARESGRFALGLCAVRLEEMPITSKEQSATIPWPLLLRQLLFTLEYNPPDMSTPPPRRIDPCTCGSGRRYKDCHGSLRQASGGAAGEAAGLNRRGHERHDAGNFDAALADFEAAIAADPMLAHAHYNRGVILLMRADYARAWPEYEWRTRMPGYADYANFAFGMPRWRGEPLAGRSILVHAEQGHGDTIQFARFIAPLAAAGATVDVFCHEPLVTLIARVPGVRHAFGRLRERPTHDYHAPMLDVAASQLRGIDSPHWFGPYVHALPEREERFSSLLRERLHPVVGIAWKGSARHANDRNRSLSREAAAALLAAGRTRVNLQLGEEPLDASMIDAASGVTDWDDTAAVIAHLDHVITVDTAVAHLAGAMGKPVTVLLPFVPDWRWRESGETTPWYPSMRLLRQVRPGDWRDTLQAAIRYPAASPR
jgi:hypothetical protein